MHPETLLDESVRREIPVYATRNAIPKLRALSPRYQDVIELQDGWTLPKSWTHRKSTDNGNGEDANVTNEKDTLPEGIRLLWLPTRERRGLAHASLHIAIVVLWSTPNESNNSRTLRNEALVYSPHGTLPPSIPPWLADEEQVKVQALIQYVPSFVLHPFHTTLK